MRASLERASGAVDGEVAALAMERWARRRAATFDDAAEGLCFGRLDLDEVPRPLYVGRRWVHDAERDVVVVNWQAPASRPFYTATPVDPQRVRLRRRFRTDGRLVVGTNRTFMEYVAHVLPALGESAVEQRAVAELVDGVEPRREELPEVARL